MASTLPDIVALSMPFANNGDRNSLPTQQTDPGNGAASLATGFPPETGIPVDDGGIPPARPDMNALGYLSTQPLWLLQQGGYYTFNSDVSNAIGGYPLGAILYYSNTSANPPEYKFLRSAKANNTDNFVSNPSFIGTSWIDVTPKTPGGMQIGSIFAHGSSVPPAGAYLLNGQTIANCQTLYPTFWTWVNSGNVRVISSSEYTQELSATGVCGGFVVDSTAGSIRLPSVVNGTLWGADASSIGQSLAAGLPNITGSFYGIYRTSTEDYSGAFQTSKENVNGIDFTSSSTRSSPATFNASRSNSIYGKSNTVQPPAIRVSWCIQVYNATTDLSEQESAQIASEMQTKAQTNLANVSANLDFVVESWKSSDGSSWYRKYRSGWIEQGGELPIANYSADAGLSVTLFIEFTTDKYYVNLSSISDRKSEYAYHPHIHSRGTTSFVFDNSSSNEIGYLWYACGY